MLLARHWNRQARAALFYAGQLGALALGTAGGAALLLGPWLSGMDPASHAYPAIVWLLSIWTVLHVTVGLIMHVYCLASRLRQRTTARHDIDLHNVSLYWHFTLLTVLITTLVIAGFPLVARGAA
jgi:cytochrome c oxidase subunit I+III